MCLKKDSIGYVSFDQPVNHSSELLTKFTLAGVCHKIDAMEMHLITEHLRKMICFDQ